MGDFIPTHPRKLVRHDQLFMAHAVDDPSVRCHRQTSEDVQSGPICCGKKGVVRAYNKDGSRCWVAWCAGHVPERFQKAAKAGGDDAD